MSVLVDERSSPLPIEAIPGLVAVLSPDGGVERVNSEIEAYCGQTIDQLRQWGSNGIVHPDDMPSVAAIFGASIASGVPYTIEQRLRRHDGKYRWFENRGRPLRRADGGIVAWSVLLIDIHDRKLAQDALTASEQNLRLTIDTIPALAWSARSDGSADFFNRHYLDYAGLPMDALRDWQWLSLIHPDELPAVQSAWERFSSGGRGGDIEARVRRHDGVYRWFSFRAHPVLDADGRAVKWYGVKVDIDDQKRATMLLAGERQLLELIASGRPLHEVLARLCSVVEAALPGSLCEVRTLDASRTVFEHVEAPSFPASYAAAIAGSPVFEKASPCDMAISRKVQVSEDSFDGSALWTQSAARSAFLSMGLTSMWAIPILARDNAVLGSLAIGRQDRLRVSPSQQDVMDRAAHVASIAIERFWAEDELHRRRFLLEEAERISGTGSYYWDLKTNKLFWSTQMHRIYEVDDGLEPVYPNLMAKVHPDDEPLVEEKIQRAFRGESSPPNVERLLFPDGRMKYISTAFRVLKHDDGRLESVGVAQDVTRQRLAEDALDKVRSELAHVTRVMSLGELAASITHEVNQPLSGIITNASTCLRMLAADPPNIDGAIQTAQLSIRDGNRAAEVIRRLRNLYRKQDLKPEQFNLNDAAEEVVAICAHDMQRRRISIRTALDPSLPLIEGDRIQLQQVILNLVLNAADAIGGSGNAGQITLDSAVNEAGAVQLTVRDNGPGISPEDLERIFEAFFTTKQNGMGIGLSVSKSILDRHGGRLWAANNDGPGATFGFAIPPGPTPGP
jgi:PAS domain S-box-containing protein